MSDLKTKIVIAGDASGAVEAASNAEAAYQKLASGLKNSLGNIDTFGKLDAEAARLSASLDEAGAALSGSGLKAQLAGQQLAGLEAEYEAAKARVAEFAAAFAASGNKSEEFGLKLKLAKEELKGLATGHKEASAAAAGAAKDYDKAAAEATALATALEKTQQKAAGIGQALENAGVDTAKLASEQQRLKNELGSVLSNLTKTAGELQQLRSAEIAAKAEAHALSGAFQTLGLARPLHDATEELHRLQAALATIKSSGTVLGPEQAAAVAAFNARVAELKAGLAGAGAAGAEATGKIGKGMDGLIATAKPMAAAIAAAFATDRLARAAVEMDSLSRSMGAVFGGSKSASAEMAYLSKTAERLGLDIGSAGKAYVSLAASAKGTALEGQATRDIFEAVAGSMSALGKTSAETEGALLAIQQMMSKGVVSAEEFRGQLAERLPGALKLAADALGVTEQQFNALMESGNLMANDMLPRLAAGLKATYNTGARADSLVAGWNRFQNAITEATGKMTKTTTGITGIELALGTLRETALLVGTGIVTVFESIGVSAKSAAVAVAYLAGNGTWAQAKKEIREMADESAARINALAEKTATAGKVAELFGNAVQDAGEKAKTAGESISQQGTSMSAISGALKQMVAAWEEYATEAERVAEIDKLREKNASDRITIAGTEIEIARQLAHAADQEAAAAQRLADTKASETLTTQSLLESMRAELAQRVAVLEAEGKSVLEIEKQVEAQRKAIKETEKLAEAKQFEAEKTRMAAEGSGVDAEKKNLAAIAAKDNSDRVEELRKAYEDATVAVAAYEKLKDGSPEKAKAYEAAVKAQGAALHLYRDALKDATEAQKQKEQAVQRATALEAGAVAVQIEAARAAQGAAKARGQETQAIREGVTIKELEAKQSRVVAEGKRLEAEASKKTAAAQIEEIKNSGEMTPAKEREIAAINDSVKAKQQEAEKAAQSARASDAEAEATRKEAAEKIKAVEAAKEMADAHDKLASSTHIVKREVSAFSVDNQALAEQLGLSGEAAEAFARKFSEVLPDAMQTARSGAQDAVSAFSTGWSEAERAAKQYAESVAYVNDLTERLSKAAAGGAGDLAALLGEAEKAAGGVEGLGDQELSSLRSALASAQQQMESLKDSADSTLASLQEELAQMNGNYAEAERLRYEARRADLEAQLALASAQGNSAAAAALSRAISTLDQIATRKIAEARQREAEELARAGKTSSQASQAAGAVSAAAGAVAGAVSNVAGVVASAAQVAQSVAQAAAAVGISSGGGGRGGSGSSLSGMTGGEGSRGEVGGGETTRPESGAREPAAAERRSGDGGSSSRAAPAIHINFHGAHDFSARSGLEAFARQLAPVLSDLARRSK